MVKTVKIKNKKALVIAYSFPPVGRDRSTRTLKFVKFLSRMGWGITVLTVKKPLVPNYDYSLVDDIPKDVHVIRTSSIEGNFFRRTVESESGFGSRVAQEGFARSFIKRVSDLFILPDSRIGWVPFTVFSGIKAVRNNAIDVIYVSGEPFSSFISAAIIKIITRRPLIFDFRDDWVGFNSFFREKGRFVQIFELMLERWVINSSNAIITVNQAIAEDISKRHFKNREKRKVLTIYNGFDRDDLVGSRDCADSQTQVLRLAYSGSLYPKRSAFAFFSALSELFLEKPHLKKRIEVVFAGNVYIKKELARFPQLKDVIEYKGFLSYAQSLSLMRSAHVLIFIEDQSEVSNRVLSGKIFDYLLCAKPILAIAGSGLVRDMVLETCAGKVALSNDINSIKSSLLDLIEEFERTGKLSYFPNMGFIDKFDRQKQSEELSQVMEELINAS